MLYTFYNGLYHKFSQSIYHGRSKSTTTTLPLFQQLISHSRAALAKSITLSESTLDKHKSEAGDLMSLVLKHNQKKKTLRIGISGPPGAGKSTFIEALGLHITKLEHKLAVLAVDPSSVKSGGSLLADKTRMQKLSANRSAFIRPSPSRGHLGGVARTTNNAIQLCEAGGYHVILVETVGAGQSEIAVANMTDIFILLIPPGSGDELQGIKKGIVEVANIVVVTKADGDLKTAARLIKTEYSRALRLIRREECKGWKPFVSTVSSVTGEGIAELWDDIQDCYQNMLKSGIYTTQREYQRTTWMWDHIQEDLITILKTDSSIKNRVKELEASVRLAKVTPNLAAEHLLDIFLKKYRN